MSARQRESHAARKSLPDHPPHRVTRGECLLLALVIFVAVAARCAWPTRLAIEHFDEGVYASDVWFGIGTDQGYPFRYLYAPPLVPLISELTLLLGGMHPAAPLWAGIVAGLATVISVWWIGRAWFSAAAGLCAAALAAASDVHALFSRTALTDPWLLLWFVWSLYFIERAVRRRTYGDVVAAGAFTALAWWTKYNGWLPLAIGAGSIALATVLGKIPPRKVWREGLAWLAVAVIAVLAWSPALYGLRDVGGYGAVAANHRRYIVGISGWFDSFVQQAEQLRAQESLPALLAASVLLLAIGVWKGRATALSGPSAPAGSDSLRKKPLVAASVVALCFLVCASAAGYVSLITALAVFSLASEVTGYCQSNRDRNESVPSSLGSEMLVTWFVGLFILTPLYHPYARLTLPWLAASWLGAGQGITVLWECISGVAMPHSADGPGVWSRRVVLPVIGPVAVLAVALCLGGIQMPTLSPAAWRDRSDLQRATRMLVEAASKDVGMSDSPGATPPEFIIDVLGEPAVYFHLRAHWYSTGWPHAAPLGDVSSLARSEVTSEVPVLLMVGPHATHQDDFRRLEPQLRPIAVESFEPSPVLALDHPVARDDADYWQLRLYRVK